MIRQCCTRPILRRVALRQRPPWGSELQRCHSTSENPYTTLGLAPGATKEEIKSAFLRLAKKRHPDNALRYNLPIAEATARFQTLVAAHEVLASAAGRAAFSSGGGGGRGGFPGAGAAANAGASNHDTTQQHEAEWSDAERAAHNQRVERYKQEAAAYRAQQQPSWRRAFSGGNMNGNTIKMLSVAVACLAAVLVARREKEHTKGGRVNVHAALDTRVRIRAQRRKRRDRVAAARSAGGSNPDVVISSAGKDGVQRQLVAAFRSPRTGRWEACAPEMLASAVPIGWGHGAAAEWIEVRRASSVAALQRENAQLRKEVGRLLMLMQGTEDLEQNNRREDGSVIASSAIRDAGASADANVEASADVRAGARAGASVGAGGEPESEPESEPEAILQVHLVDRNLLGKRCSKSVGRPGSGLTGAGSGGMGGGRRVAP